MAKVKKLSPQDKGSEPIKSDIKDGQITLQIPHQIKTAFDNMFKENKRLMELAKIVHWSKKDKDLKGMHRLVVQPRKNLDAGTGIELGGMLTDLRYKAAAQATKAEFEKKQKQKQPPVRLKFDFGREIIDEFKQFHADSLHMKKFKANLDGSADLYFDYSHCQNRLQVIMHTLKIADAVNDVRLGNRHKRDIHMMNQIIKRLNEIAPDIQITHREFVEMTGMELIEKGLATAVNDDSMLGKTLGFFVKLIKGQGNFRYLFHGKEVNPEKTYVVRLEKPEELKKPVKADHAKTVRLAYEAGEAMFAGAGGQLVNRYANEIVDAVNKHIKSLEE